MITMNFEQMEQTRAQGCGADMTGYFLSFIGVCSGAGTLIGLLGMAVAFSSMTESCHVDKPFTW